LQAWGNGLKNVLVTLCVTAISHAEREEYSDKCVAPAQIHPPQYLVEKQAINTNPARLGQGQFLELGIEWNK
jgi:hypothetical protein